MSQIMAPFQLLELNVISAQDLASLGRKMRTYAVAWVHPDKKLSTRVDTQGHTHPTWNDKFVFRVDEEFLYSDTSAIMIEIYALHWFKDIHVGTVRVLVGNLLPPSSRPFHNDRAPLGMRFVALQVRRPSGRPQGILNIGVTVLDSSMRSMPLYTLNSSAVGYRHLMGEKDAYNSHNHLSPHVLATPGRGGKAELRRTKSDTSSVLASEAVMRHQRAIMNQEKANSAISGSEVSNDNVKKNKKKKKKNKPSSSQASSILSSVSGQFTNSVLSDAVVPWKVKNGKTSSTPSDTHVEQPQQPPFSDEEQHNHYENEVDHDHDYNDNDDDDEQKEVSSVNIVSEAATTDTDINEKHNNAYQVKATPKRHFPPSPAVAPAEYTYSPKPKFMKSPTMPEYKNSPKPQFKNSPMPGFKNSPKPQFKNSPMPDYKNSPKPNFMRSPTMPEYKNSPKPQFKNSPMPEFKNSPMRPQFRNSPMPEFKNSPMQQVRNSPMPQFRNSPKPQFQNSPAVVSQFRNSPGVTKFNPAVGFSGSHRGTPMHPFGKMKGGFEYATPMRSNLANMGPVMMTESELGPSPSEVAAAMARKPVIDEENSTVGGWSMDESVEGLQSKLERWQTELPPVIDHGELSRVPTTSTKASRHSRRHTDAGNGLFSCFSNICGVECSIVCGGDPKAKAKAKAKKNSRRDTSSADNTTSLL